MSRVNTRVVYSNGILSSLILSAAVNYFCFQAIAIGNTTLGSEMIFYNKTEAGY